MIKYPVNYQAENEDVTTLPIVFVGETFTRVEGVDIIKIFRTWEPDFIKESFASNNLYYAPKLEVTFSESTEQIIPDDTWAHNKMQKLLKIAKQNKFEKPNRFVIGNSIQALNCIKDNDATLLFCNPTSSGGAIIEFKKNNIYFILEIDNDHDIAILKKNDVPLVEELDEETFLISLQSYLADA